MAILFLPTIFAHMSYFHRFPLKTASRFGQVFVWLPAPHPRFIPRHLRSVVGPSTASVHAYILSKSTAEAFEWSCQKGAFKSLFLPHLFWLNLGDSSQLSYLSIWLSFLHSKVSRKETRCLQIPPNQNPEEQTYGIWVQLASACHPFTTLLAGPASWSSWRRKWHRCWSTWFTVRCGSGTRP